MGDGIGIQPTLPGFDLADGYACPIDPMEALQCESCQ